MEAISRPQSKVFELPGSTIHYPPTVPFDIEHMWLSIRPDFESQSIDCRQQLKITTKQQLDEIILDSVDLQISFVYLSYATILPTNEEGGDYENNIDGMKKLDFEQKDKEIVIKLGKVFSEGSRFHIIINYVANPDRGFNFVSSGNNSTDSHQAWTQGQPSDSKYWFPCIDHPQIKYSRDVSVIVPKKYQVISNGELVLIETETENDRKYAWQELNPNPTYLTAIIIGSFADMSNGEIYDGRVPLNYFVPPDRKSDADRTFKDTSKMMEFLEKFLDTKYAYSKYSQITIEEFPYGGMENTTCTTLTTDLLHDEIAHKDYSSDDVIIHELAHHWFGDLVTCRDWQHVWLNEGFATYLEALYFEHVHSTAKPNLNEFQYYVLQMADFYIDEAANLYERPLVTKLYSHPDELFDFGHTYKKAGYVLHMIRNYVGNEDFVKSLKLYLDRFKHKTVETDDWRQVLEEVSGKSLQQFFDQWVYQAGHPILEIDLSLDKLRRELKVKITQIPNVDGQTFEFPLELRITYLNDSNTNKPTSIMISEQVTEVVFKIPQDKNIAWVSIDPYYKILKEIRSMKCPMENLILQLQNAETVFEIIDAIRALRNKSSDEVIVALRKNILEDPFWAVSSESANALGTINDPQYAGKAYDSLKECLNLVVDLRIKSAIIDAIGEFRRPDSFDLLKPILEDEQESYFVRKAASVAIAWTLRNELIPLFEALVEKSSFQGLIAQGAIIGLTIIAKKTGDPQIVKRTNELLIEKTASKNYHGVRETATFYLNNFVIENNGSVNQLTYTCLKNLLSDSWVHTRNNACIALGNALEYSDNIEVIKELEKVAKADPDGQVRRSAWESIKKIQSKKPIQKEETMRIVAARDFEKLRTDLKTSEIDARQKRIPRK